MTPFDARVYVSFLSFHLPLFLNPSALADSLFIDVEHATCIESSPAVNRECPLCNTILVDKSNHSQLAQAIRRRLRAMATVSLGSAPTVITASSWDDSARWTSKHPHNTLNLKRQSTLPNPLEDHPEDQSRIVSQTDYSDAINHTKSHSNPEQTANKDGTPSRVSMAARIISTPPKPTPIDTRIDMDVLPRKVDRASRSVQLVKRDATSSGIVTSTSVRKAIKLGNRRLIDLRKRLSTNRRQLATFLACAICIVVVTFLMSGEEQIPTASKPVIEQISLPHVIVNPALIKKPQKLGSQHRD